MKSLTGLRSGISRTTTLVGICALALGGCSKNADQTAASKGQVVAHLGNEVVTTQELENEFRLANIPPERRKDPATVKQVLSELVLSKYLMQQAINSKLDREPGVLLDLLRARTGVLANAYMQRKVAAKPITNSDIDKYIADHPLKFANRQIYSIEQIAFQMGANAQSAIEANKEAKTLDEVDQKLTTLDLPHSRSMGILNSGDLPETLLDAIKARKEGDVFFARAGQNGLFFKVKNEESRSLEGEAARNLAHQLLRGDAMKAELGIASVAANLEAKYEGDYAKVMASQDAPSDKK